MIDKLPMEETFSEDVSRDYFVDVILGLEYCKFAFLCTLEFLVLCTCMSCV